MAAAAGTLHFVALLGHLPALARRDNLLDDAAIFLRVTQKQQREVAVAIGSGWDAQPTDTACFRKHTAHGRNGEAARSEHPPHRPSPSA